MVKDEKREAFLLGKAEGLAIAKNIFLFLEGVTDQMENKFSKEINSENAKIQLELLVNEGE